MLEKEIKTMSYHGSIYTKDSNGNYTIPVYNEYRQTKLLTAGTILKLLKGVTVNSQTVNEGVENNLYYGKQPDKIANALIDATAVGDTLVSIRPSKKNSCGYRLFIEPPNGTVVDFAIPRDTTNLSALLFGTWVSEVETSDPDIGLALQICGVKGYENADIMIKGGM
jgi:hypothetical protein